MNSTRVMRVLTGGLTVLAALSFCPGAAASDEYPFTGVVNGHDANARAGANLNYEIVTQLQKGDLVLVVGKWMQWLKIRSPEGTILWASAEYIQDGKVIANKLNVRSGANLKYNVICQLSREDEVEVVKTSEDGKWAGITPPEQAYLCIHEDLIDRKGGSDLYNAHSRRKAEVENKLSRVELKRELNMKKKPEEVPFEDLISEYEAIAKGYPEFEEELKMLVEDPSLRESMGQNGRNYVLKQYAWPAVEARIVQALAQWE